MILFRSIRWKNLLSTGNYFTEIKLDTNSNTLIVGENASGKSTMLDALCFALFGKAFRNINKPQLVNSINNKDCVVEVLFDANNKSYKVIRGMKPNIFQIYQDGELINQEAASKDYQELLEKIILKLNYKSFTQIVILGSASFVPFMQLSASDRRAIIEDLLDIQIFSAMNSIVKDRLIQNKDSMTTVKHEIDLAQQKYEFESKRINEIKENNDEKIKEYETEIQTHNDTISSLSANVTVLTGETELLQTEVAIKTKIESRVKEITKLELQIENNLQKFRKDIGFFQSHDDCPTCKQAIAASFKQDEIGRLEGKATSCEHGLSELESKFLEQQAKLNEINEKQKIITQKQVEIATINTTITGTNQMIVRLQKMINDLKSIKTSSESEETELNNIKDDLTKLKTQLKTLIDDKSYHEVAGNLLKDTGIKTKIIKQYLPIINKLINKYLATLNFFVNFTLDESFKETIKSRYRDEFSYANFSEGEKQRIDMALMLTWRAIAKLKNSTNTNLLILDEIFDSSLDTNGTEELMKILHMLEDVSLFVISHKGDVLLDKFANVIRFDKQKNFSRIVK